MKRVLLLLTASVVTMITGLSIAAHAAQSTDNFTISTYDIDMRLGRDEEGRSTLEVTETITAQFRAKNQNRGIERAFAKEYDGHDTSFELVSVTDERGNERAYHWQNDTLRIGDKNTYVDGKQVYKITYRQRDVTRYYEDTDRDEFYWDVIGTEWRVPIMSAHATLTLDEALADARRGGAQCYRGAQGSDTKCSIKKLDATTYEARVFGLSAKSGVTFALGFAPETFAAYQPSLFEKLLAVWVIVQLVTFIIAVATLIWLVMRFMRIVNRSRELKPISPEYIPPTNASVTVSSRVTKSITRSVMTAQLLDLAVRHYVKLYEVKERSLFGLAEYEVEITKNAAELRVEEQELVKDMFGRLPAVGERMNLKKLKNNTKYYMRTTDNDKQVIELIRGRYGFVEHDAATKKWLRKTALIMLVVGVLIVSIPLLVVAIAAFGLSFMSYRLTDAGLSLRRYLEGLKMYIGVAEEDRLRMLQSPEGAEKVASAVGGTDEKSLVKLYERVLPYAVLFNQEKEWSKTLGKYYEQVGVQPDWYAGRGAFNAVVFASAMSNLSQAASQASSYASSSSSSSGGSSGGGFSGGGGGGGGGGGW